MPGSIPQPAATLTLLRCSWNSWVDLSASSQLWCQAQGCLLGTSGYLRPHYSQSCLSSTAGHPWLHHSQALSSLISLFHPPLHHTPSSVPVPSQINNLLGITFSSWSQFLVGPRFSLYPNLIFLTNSRCLSRCSEFSLGAACAAQPANAPSEAVIIQCLKSSYPNRISCCW